MGKVPGQAWSFSVAIKLTKINLSSTIFPSMTPRCTHAHTQLCTSIQVNRLPASQLQEHTDSRRLLVSRKGSIGKMFCMQLTTKLQHLSLCGLSKVTFLEKRWGVFFLRLRLVFWSLAMHHSGRSVTNNP